MIEISVRRRREFQGAETDFVESLVVDAVSFVTVLDKLMDREGSVVRLERASSDEDHFSEK
jgi:hypothetical protein